MGKTYLIGNIVPRVTTIVSNATPTVNVDLTDDVTITALAVAITNASTNLSGSPDNFQQLTYRIKDDGTARAITWGASFVAMGVALPTTTIISTILTVGFQYDAVQAKWGCVYSSATSVGADWALAGNTLTGTEHAPTEFLGSVNNFDVVFRENNVEFMRIYDGLLGIGEAVPTAKMDLKSTGTGAGTYAIKLRNSAGIVLMTISDNGQITAGVVGTNLFIGFQTGLNRSTGVENVGLGYNAMQALTTAAHCIAIGYEAMYNNAATGNCIAIGQGALKALGSVATGTGDNIAIGFESNLSGGAGINYQQISIGSYSLRLNTGGENTVIGHLAIGLGAGAANFNVGVGNRILQNLTTGQNNIAVGWEAGKTGTTMSGCIFLGFSAGSKNTASEKLFIDNRDRGTIAAELLLSFMVGTLGVTPIEQTLRVNANIETAASVNNRARINVLLYGATTDAATAVELTTDGAAGSGTSNRITVPASTALSVVINICVKQAGSANAKQMLRQFVIVNNGGTTTIAGAVAVLGTDSGSAGLATVTCTITANDTNDAIKVEVNGVFATNLRYSAYLVSTETLYD